VQPYCSLLQAATGRFNLFRSLQNVSSVPFEYVVLGDKMHKGKNGFDTSFGGNWLVLRLFCGNDDAELLLNLNTTINKGEFSIKDPDYGDYLIAQLSKIL
jgi:hypothetical protein